MCFQPIFQGVIHPSLPTLAGALEGLDDFCVVAHRQRQLGALRLGAATGQRLTQSSRARFRCNRPCTNFPLALLEKIIRQLRCVIRVNPRLG